MNRNSLFFIQRSFCSIFVTIWTISPYFLHFSIEPWTPGLIINRCLGKEPSLFPRETKTKVVRATEIEPILAFDSIIFHCSYLDD